MADLEVMEAITSGAQVAEIVIGLVLIDLRARVVALENRK